MVRRCVRLNKDCQPAPTVRRRKVAKRQSSANAVAHKTAALEERLDTLVRLLQQPDRSPSQAGVTVSIPHRNDERTGLPSGSASINSGADTTRSTNVFYGSQNGVASDISHASSSSYQSPAQHSTPSAQPSYAPTAFSHLHEYPIETEDEGKEYLDRYRTKFFPYFPIIYIAPDVTVESLRASRPYVWLAIRAICSRKLIRQRALSIQMRKILAQKVVVECIRSLDLLQGILLYVAWGHWFIQKNPTTIMNQLAMSLVADLGLAKPLPNESASVLLNYTPRGCPDPTTAFPGSLRTIEERRTVVGHFLITTMYVYHVCPYHRYMQTIYASLSSTIWEKEPD